MSRPASAPRATWSRVHVLAALSFGTALGACFNPPAAAVMFSCTPDDADACPGGYTCEADGCCHRDGSDVSADYGGCGLGAGTGGPPDTSTGATTTAPTTTGATAEPSTGTATTTTGETTATDPGATTSTGSTGPGTTGDTSTSTDASTGDTGGSSGADTTG